MATLVFFLLGLWIFSWIFLIFLKKYIIEAILEAHEIIEKSKNEKNDEK